MSKNSVKTFTKNVLVGTSKTKGKKYLYIKEDGNLVFVGLIKDNKGYKPNLDGVTSIDVTYTSYKREDNRLALFGVTDVAFYKA